jgi:hypothetical protein
MRECGASRIKATLAQSQPGAEPRWQVREILTLEQAPLTLPVDLGKRRKVVLPSLWDDEVAAG